LRPTRRRWDPIAAWRGGGDLCAHGGKIDLVVRDIERGHIVAGVERHPGRGAVRQLGGGNDVLPPQIEWLTAQFVRDLIDQPLERIW
jgi:hypothetical protein